MFKFNKKEISKMTVKAAERKVNEKRANKKFKKDFKEVIKEIKAQVKYEAKREKHSLKYSFHFHQEYFKLENAVVEKLRALGFTATLNSFDCLDVSW